MLFYTKIGVSKRPRYHPNCAKSTALRGQKRPLSVNAGKRPSFRRRLRSSTQIFENSMQSLSAVSLALWKNGNKKVRFFINAITKYNEEILLLLAPFVKTLKGFCPLFFWSHIID